MILEFIGLPGAGKSTLTTPLVKRMSEIGLNVCDFSVHHKTLMGSISGKTKFLFFVIINVQKVINLKRNLNYTNIYKGAKDRFFKLLVLLFSIREYKKRAKDSFLFMDQGIVQMINSIYFKAGYSEFSNSNTIINESLKFIGVQHCYATIQLDVTMEIASQRIRNRDKETCEFNKMADSELYHALRCYQSFFSTVRPWFMVNSSDNIDHNILLICDKLIKSKYYKCIANV